MTSHVTDAEAIPDLTSPATYLAGVPHTAFGVLRERPGLYWQPSELTPTHGGYWAVTRASDIVEIEKDWSVFTSTHGVSFPVLSPTRYEGPLADNLIFSDPPRHTALRRMIARGFGPRVVANFDPWIREIVREAIENVAGLDEFDAVEAFARTIPAYVIGRILGVPREDRAQHVEWVFAIFEAISQTTGLAPDVSVLDNVDKVTRAIATYGARLREIKRKNPADDMATVLGECVDAGEVTQGEFEQWMILIMGAGFETTHTAIAHALRMYVDDGEVQQATDRAHDEDQLGRAVDEYIRLTSPIIQMARVARSATEVAGQHIREGDVMVLYYAAANRDSAVYRDPDKFDPWRTEKDSLAFGTGIHRCIGSHLAKLEVQILFEELRTSGLRLRLNGTPKRGRSCFINQLTELPVTKR